MGKRKHYQTGADSCACGNLWPCTRMTGPGKKKPTTAGQRMQKEIDRAKAKQATSAVQRGDYVFIVKTRPGGPPFDKWLESVDSSLSFMAEMKGRLPKDRIAIRALDLWPRVEQARTAYEAGQTPASFASKLVLELNQQHYEVPNPDFGSPDSMVCACGERLPCPRLQSGPAALALPSGIEGVERVAERIRTFGRVNGSHSIGSDEGCRALALYIMVGWEG